MTREERRYWRRERIKVAATIGMMILLAVIIENAI